MMGGQYCVLFMSMCLLENRNSQAVIATVSAYIYIIIIICIIILPVEESLLPYAQPDVSVYPMEYVQRESFLLFIYIYISTLYIYTVYPHC